jgi:hypothetical protein
MSAISTITRLAGAALLGTLALAPAAWAQSRGELLYSTHCIACHTTEKHWRDKRVASDWTSLKALVRHWQAAALLGWNDDDILAVTRHLNETYYHFSGPADRIGALPPSAPGFGRLAALAEAGAPLPGRRTSTQ